MERFAVTRLAAVFCVALVTTACAPSANEVAASTAASASSNATGATDSAARPAALTDANLEAYGRALAKQAEIIRRPGRGTHYGVSMSAYGLDGQAGEVLEAAGMSIDEYREAAPEWKAKLEGDPFATLPPESAAVLRRNMDTLVPLWSDVVGLTAQHGR